MLCNEMGLSSLQMSDEPLFLLCALFTTIPCSDGDAADDALSAIDTPPAAETAPVYDLLQGTWEAS